MTTTYYHGTDELVSVYPVRKSVFKEIGGIPSKHNYVDGYDRLIGKAADGRTLPVTRKIYFRANPSLHKCNAKCRGATGHDCQCECRGKFHGAG